MDDGVPYLIMPYKWPMSEDCLNKQFNYYLSKVYLSSLACLGLCICSEHAMGYLKGQFQSLWQLCQNIDSEHDWLLALTWICVCIITCFWGRACGAGWCLLGVGSSGCWWWWSWAVRTCVWWICSSGLGMPCMWTWWTSEEMPSTTCPLHVSPYELATSNETLHLSSWLCISVLQPFNSTINHHIDPYISWLQTEKPI